MNDINTTLVSGRLTRDPEYRELKNDNAVAEFSLAVNRKFGEKEEVSFVDCTFFGKQATAAKNYLAKGRAILVTGRLNQDRWETKDTNEKRSKLVIVGERWDFLPSSGPKKDQETGEEENSAEKAEGDLPF